MRRAALATAAVIGLAACADGSDGDQSAGQEQSDPPTPTSAADPFSAPPTAQAPDRPMTAPPEQPEWSGPPEDEIGSVADLDPVVFESEDVVVALTAVTVYSTGAEVDVVVHTRPDGGGGRPGEDPMGSFGRPSPVEPGGPPPDDLLRIGVVYPDGETASTLDDGGRPDEEPTGPLLNRTMSQGTGSSFEYEMWLWSLPDLDEGSLVFAAQWPEEGIDEREDVDLARLDAAADGIVQLWR